jgi:hypothetical protein
LTLNAAAHAGGFEIIWHTIDGGGAAAAPGPGYSISGTIGQHDACAPLASNGLNVAGGYWGYGGGVNASCHADVAPAPGGDGVVDVLDLLEVIVHWGACAVPPATCHADIAPIAAHDGMVNVLDLLQVIVHWGDCAN